MRHFSVEDLSVQEAFALLLSGVSPRPIALVATVNEGGGTNLSPFSFFNAFGANPPTVAFSPAARVRDGTLKDTYYNLERSGECTIQVVTFGMVEQVNLASTEYAAGVDEFVKSGLTPVPSDLVAPPRVGQSPFQMECRLERIVHLGKGKGSGNLMICRVLKFHVAEKVFGHGGIDPHRMDLVARNGADYYTRASGPAIFEVAKPGHPPGIGYDGLPDHIRLSEVLTAGDIAKLAGASELPDLRSVADFAKRYGGKAAADGAEEPQADLERGGGFERLKRAGDYEGMVAIALLLKANGDPRAPEMVEAAAKEALAKNDRDFAWLALMCVF